MYIRTIKRKNKDGSVVEYVQLAHNVRHPQKGYPKAEVIHSFGRRDQLDIAALKRLVVSVSRFFEPEAKTESPAAAVSFVRSRAAGGIHLLRHLWNRLGMNVCLYAAIESPPVPAAIALTVFVLVAKQALAPSSKSPIRQWLAEDIFWDDGADLTERHLVQAETLLRDHADALQAAAYEAVVRQVAAAVSLPDGQAAGTDVPGRLAGLLTHTAEVATGLTWPVIRDEMQRLQLGEFIVGGESLRRYSPLRPLQRQILDALAMDPPPPDFPIDL
ncbi:hypothetical protein DESC_720182 [Desulfosarcina cetonica]|uniref:hypothetical protein n=1 Tax=Desulfosarcina cetonica TaxID=90730 RepID=UPI0006D041C0|nr:hypothetical protein [Desulfosarcina cetonica]VTR68804.1 hypothetical protein DESC_720182 [Desulfosarcina cetonica]